MEKINLFLIDMSEDGTFAGVTRYMETLLRGLASFADMEVVSYTGEESTFNAYINNGNSFDSAMDPDSAYGWNVYYSCRSFQ